MELSEKEYGLYSILSGKYYIHLFDEKYISVPNTLDEIHYAWKLYHDHLEDLKYDDIMTFKQSEHYCHQLGIWTYEDEAKLDQFNNLLEDLKFQIYTFRIQPDKVKSIRKNIRNIEKAISRSTESKYAFYYVTKEYNAEQVKEQYLIGSSIRDSNNKRVFDLNNFEDWDDKLIELFQQKINTQRLSNEQVRLLAKTDPFRFMWNLSKDKNLEGNASTWNYQQRLLVSYSAMYDNVRESMDCPEDYVIDDDDMLDGWFISQKKERQKKQKEKSIDERFGKIKNNANGQEIYIMADNPHDAKDIYGINDTTTRNVIKNRNSVIKSQDGSTTHAHLPDVQMNLRMQAAQEQSAHFRKG